MLWQQKWFLRLGKQILQKHRNKSVKYFKNNVTISEFGNQSFRIRKSKFPNSEIPTAKTLV